MTLQSTNSFWPRTAAAAGNRLETLNPRELGKHRRVLRILVPAVSLTSRQQGIHLWMDFPPGLCPGPKAATVLEWFHNSEFKLLQLPSQQVPAQLYWWGELCCAVQQGVPKTPTVGSTVPRAVWVGMSLKQGNHFERSISLRAQGHQDGPKCMHLQLASFTWMEWWRNGNGVYTVSDLQWSLLRCRNLFFSPQINHVHYNQLAVCCQA